MITWDAQGNIQLSTFEECLNKVADEGFSYVLNTYNDSVPSYMHSSFYGIEILPIHSNPCAEDSDGDGLDDFSEKMKKTNPLKVDTDGDGINDFYDRYPTIYNENTYNRKKAVEYALEWGGKDENDKDLQNKEWYHGKAALNDCANFVSQCVSAGDYIHTSSWFMKRMYLPYVSGKISGKVNGFHYDWGWMWSTAWLRAPEQYEYFKEYYSTVTFNIYEADDLQHILDSKLVQEGDLLYFVDNTSPSHATFISEVTDDDIYYASHTDNYTKESVKNNYHRFSAYSKLVIVCLDDIVEVQEGA